MSNNQIQLLKERVMKQSSLSRLAEYANCSVAKVCRAFKAESVASATKEQIEVLNKAVELLRSINDANGVLTAKIEELCQQD